MVVPLRFRSDGCRFSEKDWDSLRTTITYSLRHSPVVLEGLSVDGTEWDDLLEDLLDARGVGEKYWGSSQGRGWIFPKDRYLIQPILKTQVVEMAGERLKAVKAVEKLYSEARSRSSGAVTQKELDAAKQNDNPIDGNSAAPQRRGPGRPRKNLQIPGARPEKRVAAEESTPSSGKRTRVTRGGERAEGMRAGTEPGLDDSSVTNANDQGRSQSSPIAVENLKSPATPVPASANTRLVFETRLINTQKTKFIYATDTPSSSLFLGKVREKFQLRKEQKIESIEVEIGSKVFVVDLEEERDWLAIIGAAEKSGDSGVSVVVGIA